MHKIGIDLGGTKIESILLDENNSIIKKKRIPTEKQKGYNFIFNSIISQIKEMSFNLKEETSIGIGINGTVMKKTGTITHSSTNCIIGSNLKIKPLTVSKINTFLQIFYIAIIFLMQFDIFLPEESIRIFYLLVTYLIAISTIVSWLFYLQLWLINMKVINSNEE